MDRLICGDVGYGKTEIAIRAAFKAVQEGKQGVYLVPTTILAQQHYNTFVQRMKDFPINIALMSRFRTPSEIKKTVKDLEKGMVDIVIGTHRVLSADVKFKDLGLLIIDEEQRFGVAHKEKIKKLKENVDVLTLTAATPTALFFFAATAAAGLGGLLAYLLGGLLADRTPALADAWLCCGEASAVGALGALLTALITALSTASGVGLHIGAALCCAFLALMAGGILCFLRRYVTTRFTCSCGQSC